MRRMVSLVAASLVWLSAPACWAHFLWLGVEPSPQAPVAALSFSEEAGHGETDLAAKVAHAKVWIRTPDGVRRPLTLSKHVQEDEAAWTAPLCEQGPYSLEAMCDYGVVKRDGTPFLLQYYAKHVEAAGDQLVDLARADDLGLDIAPRPADDGIELEVLFRGAPAKGAEVVVIKGDGEPQELKTDEHGKLSLPGGDSGTWSIRAKHVEPQSGQRDAEQYSEIRHYSTLTLATQPGAAKESTTAAELLTHAREARAVWGDDFNGFRANVVVRVDGKTERGTIEVDANGETKLSLGDSPLKKWASQQLASLVQHRMPSVDSDEKVAFADDEASHPLGRLINLGDKMNSFYRVKNDVVTEVNRRMGDSRFTISVLETFRNADGKYLPGVFTVTFWNDKSGELKASHAITNTWTRVDGNDLPTRIFEVYTAPDKREVREMILTDIRLNQEDGATTAAVSKTPTEDVTAATDK